jgi:hypothetical protein
MWEGANFSTRERLSRRAQQCLFSMLIRSALCVEIGRNTRPALWISYVNDRPYVLVSFLSAAMAPLGTAMRAEAKGERIWPIKRFL